MSFAVHGTSELSLTGASAALLIGVGVGIGAVVGSVVAAVLFGLLGTKARERDSVIGVIMAFGLGLSVLFLWAYDGRTGTSFSLLVGQIVANGNSGMALLVRLSAVVVLGTLAVIYRPLLFASTDPEVAPPRRGSGGAPCRSCSRCSSASPRRWGVQIVGALLVMRCGSPRPPPPGTSPRTRSGDGAGRAVAELAAVAGILLSLAPGVPVSTFVTTISFVIYLVCRAIGASRRRSAGTRGRPGRRALHA